jgi:AraC family transcriptional regulator
MEDEYQSVSRNIYHGDLVEIGFLPRHPSFEDSGPIGPRNLLVFPRTCVTITHEGREPVVANPNVVMLYISNQIYRRGKLSESGDRCEWFSFQAELLVDALRSYDPEVESHHENPFFLTHAPADATSYLLQRLVVDHILSGETPDRLFIEETMLQVLDRTLHNAFQPPSRREGGKPHHNDLVHNLKAMLATNFQKSVTLDEIASQLHYSPFYLSRMFRQSTGISIHRYLNQIRLRTSLEWIVDGVNFTELSFLLGYSSHSHFTQAFRKEFGLPPSAIRRSHSLRVHPGNSRIRSRI